MSDTDLSSRIRHRREQLSLSQEELAARMGADLTLDPAADE